jgi:hypothetical protein
MLTIIIRIKDDAHAKEILVVGAMDFALEILGVQAVFADEVYINYRSSENIEAAKNGESIIENVDSWTKEA